MRDALGRDVDQLRISLTQRCNLTCPYCHREGQSHARHEAEAEHFAAMVREAVRHGVRRGKLTGGEPLMRRDICDIIRSIKAVRGIREVSMTTNGALLPRLAFQLKEAGLDRVNIGCDSLTRGALQKHRGLALPAVRAAKRAGLTPIKLNMVVLRDANTHALEGMLQFAQETGCTLQLIELINTDAPYYARHFVPLQLLEERLAAQAERVQQRKLHNRRVYWLKGTRVEVVAASREDFCAGCRRMRITSLGEWKPCLRRQDNHLPASEGYLAALALRGRGGALV